MRKPIGMVLIFAMLLAGCNFTNRFVVKAKSEIATYIVIPLDNRPVNTDFPIHMAKTGAIRIIMPPMEELKDNTKMNEWLLQHADEADGFILSADMLAYGGLVESRVPERSFNEVLNNLIIIRKLKKEYKDKPLFVYDTLQRTTISALEPEQEKFYHKIRDWAILKDQVENYGITDKKEQLLQIEKAIPSELLERYGKARARNHQINKVLVKWTREGIIDFLVLGQDDASLYGPQRREKEQLNQLINEENLWGKVMLYPGADELDMELIARMVMSNSGLEPNIYVEYANENAGDFIANYEDITFASNLEKHIQTLNGKVVATRDQADIDLFINTPKLTKIEKINLVAKIKESILAKRPTAVIDMSDSGGADFEFVDILTKEVELSQLLSYASWNTAGNTIGIVVSHAVVRFHLLNETGIINKELLQDSAQAQVEYLLTRFVEDVSYKSLLMPKFKLYANELQASPLNLGEKGNKVEEYVREQIGSEINRWFNMSFRGKRIEAGNYNGINQYTLINELKNWEVSLPWNRLFEVRIIPKIETETRYIHNE